MARILAVDDEPLVRRAVVRVMSRLGHSVTEAAEGTSAIRLAQEGNFDVAFVDYDMPGGPDGLTVLARLRDVSPNTVRVLITGRTDFPVVVQAVNKGEVLRVLPKPFRVEELEQVLDEVVLAARRLQEIAQSSRDNTGADRLFQEVLDGRHLELALQPIVTADAGRPIVAAECLLRSRHPFLNAPHSILDAVERANRVSEMGRVVNLLASRWATRLPEDLLLFVNIHPTQLNHPAFADHLAPLHPFAKRVVLEITERTSLRDVSHWESVLANLEGLGFRFAIDDLGSGYGGLSLLADLRPAFIKIDMSIVRDVHLKPNKLRLVDVMANFANATGARLVAEGVENEDEAAAVIQAGAHLLQGFHIARPSLDWPPSG